MTTQAEYWNAEAGARWVHRQPIMDALLAAHGECALAAAGLGEGDAALDIGCGCGATTLAAAHRVGARGLVVGVDVSAPMLAHAKRRARARGLVNVRFELGDVQAHPLEERRYNAAISRFGIMFFEEPRAAFARVCRALRGGGRFAAVCWREPRENPWIALSIEATASFLKTEPVDLAAPGPFSLSDRGRTASLLESAGFASIAVEPVDLVLTLGSSEAEAATLMVGLGPVGRALLGAPDELRRRAIDAVERAVAPYRANGSVRLPSAAWLVTAKGA